MMPDGVVLVWVVDDLVKFECSWVHLLIQLLLCDGLLFYFHMVDKLIVESNVMGTFLSSNWLC